VIAKGRRFFEVRFWGAVTGAKYATKRIKSTGSIILTSEIIGLRARKKDGPSQQASAARRMFTLAPGTVRG